MSEIRVDNITDEEGTGSPSFPNGIVVDNLGIFDSGSAGSPSITFDGDTNTGLFRPAADTLAAATNGAERIRIDSSGNVAIGRSSARAKLQIEDNITAVYTPTSTSQNEPNGVMLRLNNPDQTEDNTAALMTFNSRSSGTRNVTRWFTGALGGTGNNNGAFVIGNRTGGTAYTERMRIAPNGQQSSVIPGGTTIFPEFKCRAWVNFSGETSPGTIRGSGNVSSVSRLGTGNFRINFATAMPDANYATVGSAGGTNSANVTSRVVSTLNGGRLVGSVEIDVHRQNANSSISDETNSPNINVSVFR